MSDLRDLYQEVILDHNRSPHNFREMPSPTAHADGHNPLCGDTLTVYLDIEDGMVKDVSFVGSGCAISKASASLMTDVVKGKTLEEVREIFEGFHGMVTGESGGQSPASLGKLAVLEGVSEFPVRVKCATLAWHTLMAALEGQSDPVSTE
ncbi:MAG TPA: SUF system NifU family Fe-S cluster assembly protein [Planctomycetes bacterium]|nr:SUF system NifU family Fe-S cluster assembly protein [Planctomycetota bacterium]